MPIDGMGLRPLEILFFSFSVGTVFIHVRQNLTSTDYRHQILKYKNGPRTEKVNYHILMVFSNAMVLLYTCILPYKAKIQQLPTVTFQGSKKGANGPLALQRSVPTSG